MEAGDVCVEKLLAKIAALEDCLREAQKYLQLLEIGEFQLTGEAYIQNMDIQMMRRIAKESLSKIRAVLEER